MRILAGAIGGIIVILVLWDVVKTTLLLQGAGPLNRRLSNSIWRGGLAVHHRLPGHFFLSVAGVCILLASVSLWILLYWIGWSLIFSMSEMAVISAQNEVPASFWQRIYYVGFTFITLGIGDFKAGSALWEIITVILSISGFFIVTLVITYLLPVVSSAVEQRQLAVHIQSMRFAQGTFFSSFQETGVDGLVSNLQPLSEKICRLAQQHLAYPVLHFMQSGDPQSALPLALASLDENLTLILSGGRSLPADVENLLPLRHSLSFFLWTLSHLKMPLDKESTPESLPLKTLSIIGISPADESDFKRKLDLLRERRRLLRGFVYYTGWQWQDVFRQQHYEEDLFAEGGPEFHSSVDSSETRRQPQ